MSSPFRKAWHFILGLGVPLDMLLSVVVSVGWILVVVIATGQVGETLLGSTILLLPLALIWFRDPLSEMIGSFGFHQINADSPPGLVAFFGWLGLIAIIWLTAKEIF